MATKLENAADSDSCWSKAAGDEQVFIFRQHDRHAPALIRLWAAMREKEGEPPEVCDEARDVAQLMEDAMVAEGRTFLSLDAVMSLASSLKQAPPAAPVTDESQEPVEAPTDPYNLRVGEIVVAGRGRPAKLIKIFGTDEKTDERVRGMANIQVPRSGPVTVEFGMLRRAMPEEVEEYRNTGGRL